LIAPQKKKREQKIKTDKFKLCISKTEILILLKGDQTGNSEFSSLNNSHPQDTNYIPATN